MAGGTGSASNGGAGRLGALLSLALVTPVSHHHGRQPPASRAAEAALEPIRPYISSHGGRVEVVDVSGGTVRVRLSGACSGCTASSVTLTQGIEQALRDNLPGFVSLEAEEEQAPAHPPPGETLLQIGHRPSAHT